MDWQTQVVGRVMSCAGDHPEVMLTLLVRKLEAHPEALPAVAGALEDMGRWYQSQAAGLDAVVRVREIAAKPTPETK